MASDLGTPYLFALTNPGNEDLLKEQVARSKLALTLSFSKAGLCTFKKKDGLITQADLERFPHGYYRLLGVGAKPLKLVDNIPPSFYLDCQELKFYGAPGDEFIFKVSETSFWHAPKAHARTDFQDPYATPQVELPEAAPSRAYLKMVEALSLTPLQSALGQCKRVIELGCAPGGASFALLERGYEVFGIDPALVDESVLGHPKFHHLHKSVQDLKRTDFPGDFELLASDINLNPTLTVNYCLEVIKLLRRPPQAILLTLKTPEVSWCAKLGELRAKVKGLGLRQCELVQLPSHRRETLLYGRL